MEDLENLKARLRACTLCQGRFAATATRHGPRPVVWFERSARILVASQAPGLRVHEAMKPFWDRSGVRLRDWLGVDEATFYDRSRFAIVPMAFCFPGYSASGSDLPPPPLCAATWRPAILQQLEGLRLTLLIGGHAQRWHAGEVARGGVTETIRRWRELPEGVMALPHPSWRNHGWLKRNPWFEAEVLPVVRARVAAALEDGTASVRGRIGWNRSDPG